MLESSEVLLLFSGGKDSFLAACRLIEQGFYVRLMTFDNGCMSNTGAASDMANRLVKRHRSKRYK